MANPGQVEKHLQFTISVSGNAGLVGISPVRGRWWWWWWWWWWCDSLLSTCCCRPRPSPPLCSRTLCRSQHHSSLSDGGILTGNSPVRSRPPHTNSVPASPCTSPAEPRPPPCWNTDREDRAGDQSSWSGPRVGILRRTSGRLLSASLSQVWQQRERDQVTIID